MVLLSATQQVLASLLGHFKCCQLSKSLTRNSFEAEEKKHKRAFGPSLFYFSPFCVKPVHTNHSENWH